MLRPPIIPVVSSSRQEYGIRSEPVKVALNAQLLSASASYRSAGIRRAIYHLLADLPSVAGDEQLLVYAPDAPANRQLLHAPGVSARLNRLPMDRPAVRIAWE